ncbi:DNA replication factor C complex subunit Rfc1 [Coemansia guatemalensis]|uniref:DNA replication factor C complex subunit Rfc1 n=1 Tax=Coemansia guatemalensis TaxID=2761395 RepID=A0A9W8I5Y0_9FUNG|nr:DNA replication factor C complex subunit Rfc1 [Coemansia guatemalensis]
MARKAAAAASSRKRKAVDQDVEPEISPEDFFASTSDTQPDHKAPASKAQSAQKPKPKVMKEKAALPEEHDQPIEALAAMDIDEPSEEIGFPASELANVAPKHFFRPPKHAATTSGSIELPDGAPDCLSGLKFVATGDFADFSRDGITDLIKAFGGQVTGTVSGKTSYLVVGTDPGSTKIKKAKANGTRCLHEEDLLKLIRRSKKDESQPNTEEVQSKPDATSAKAKAGHAAPEASTVSAGQEKEAASPAHDLNVNDDAQTTARSGKARIAEKKPQPTASSSKPAATPSSDSTQLSATGSAPAASELWTEKYKPTKLKELCGQKENAKRILEWLSWWASGTVPEKRAVLISGPPGIGKTTTAHLVAKLAGFDVLELNASETRNKSSLKDILGSAVGNRSVLEFDRAKLKHLESEMQKETDKDVLQSVTTSGSKRLVVVMDEVDGMSGGDRGGSTELIQLIKKTRVPIICICNDRQSPKVRSLANHCEDLRFRRPTEAQMRARLNTIAFRENLKIDQNAIGQMVKATHNDIRQIINLMSSYALRSSTMSYLDSKAFGALNKKEVSAGPFDVIQSYLSCSDNMAMSFADKLDLYYSDYGIVPLFVQENYIDMWPNGATNDLGALEQLSRAADMIAEGDVVEGKLRGSQQWGLMPLHATLACVAPAFHARGRRNTMYRFPLWLGRNSKGTRLARQLREVQSHMRLRMALDKTEVRQSYIPAMIPEMTKPLIDQGASGIEDVVSMMDHYYLTKEHWDAMVELHMDGEQILKQIPSAVKTAFTRQYNKGSHPIAFQEHSRNTSARAVAASSESLKPDTEDYVDNDDAAEESTEESSDEGIGGDSLIKPEPKASSGKRGASKTKAAKASTSQRKRRKVYPLTAAVGACIGGLVLVAFAVAAAVVLLRRRSGSRRQQPKAAQEEESVGAHATAQHAAVCETQPLLSESAIRTRYAASPTEYAQSFIGSLPNSTLGAPQSPSQTLGRSPCNAVQHIIAVAVTDSSDSGIDSSDEEPDSALAAAFHGRPELGRSPNHDSIGAASFAGALGAPLKADCGAAACPSESMEHKEQPAAGASEVMQPIGSSNAITPAVAGENAAASAVADKSTAEADNCSQSVEQIGSECMPNVSPLPQPRELEHATPTTAMSCAAEPVTGAFAPQHQQPESVDTPHQCSSQATTPRDNSSRSRSTSADAQGVEPDLPAELTSQPSNDDTKPFKRRCRFWPTCSNGKCKYTHPRERCHMYPNCAFGSSCIYVHPGDMQKINSVIAGKGARRAKRKNDIIKFNHLESYTR